MTAYRERLCIDKFQNSLTTQKLGRKCAFFSEIGSTNTYLKRNAAVLDDGFTAISNEQIGGRGRLGKTFESPPGGLYMSVLVKNLEESDASSATVKTSVAVCEALEEHCSLSSGALSIKWVNDIYSEGKKLCGILCELVKYGEENCLIIGIGVNLLPVSRKFSPDVKKTATSLYDAAGERSDTVATANARETIAAEILSKLEHFLFRPLSYCIETYRERSFVIGKDIYVIKGKEKIPAHAYGITDDAKLCVHFSDGHFEMLYSGDVSVRERT